MRETHHRCRRRRTVERVDVDVVVDVVVDGDGDESDESDLKSTEFKKFSSPSPSPSTTTSTSTSAIRTGLSAIVPARKTWHAHCKKRLVFSAHAARK